MTMITVEQLKHLSLAEKLQLVDDLWDSIADEAAARPVTEAQRRVLDERLAAHKQNPGRGRTWDEIKAEIEQSHASTV